MFIIAGVFSQVEGIFWHFEYTIPPMIFWELSKTVFKTFLAQLGPILEGGGASDAPPPPHTESSRKLSPQK